MAVNLASADIVDRIKGASRDGRWGIGLAAHYLRQCDGSQFGVGDDDWARAIKAAEGKLVYCDPDMVVTACRGINGGETLDLRVNEDGMVFATKRTRQPSLDSVDGAVMVFDAIISSKRKDRDGDILEPGGATVDPNAPLLWQHNHLQPIGKFLEIGVQNSKRIGGRFAIADTQLGRDAAQLVAFGALRISHGFNPTDFVELEAKGDEFVGWHIKEFEIMEVSLVSVPSNVDAVITAYSQDKLHHPAVKAWARKAFDGRPVVVGGVDLADATKNYYGTIDGSWEWIRSKLNDSVLTYMRSQGVKLPREDVWVNMVATYLNYAVVTVEAPKIDETAYRIDWEMKDGEPQWTGKPKVVEISVEIQERMAAMGFKIIPGNPHNRGNDTDHVPTPAWLFDELASKAGRALSKANESRIEHARDNCTEIAGMDGVPRPAAALAREGRDKLDAVLETVAADDGEDKQTTAADVQTYLENKATAQELRDAEAIVTRRMARGKQARFRRMLHQLLGK